MPFKPPHLRRSARSLVVALALVALSVEVVAADSLIADGDGLAPVSGTRVDLGQVCHGLPSSAVALVGIKAVGHPNNASVFENGSTVTMTATTLSGVGLEATATSPTLLLAGDWRSQPNGTFAELVEWRITVTPQALGRYKGKVEFRAEGVNRHGNPVARTSKLNVVATVVDCTAPVFAGVPGDMLLEAAGPDGSDLDYLPPTATDAVDGSVPVTCDIPSPTRFPIGAGSVTCSASDDAGNAASATFLVTVADTTPPVLSDLPDDQSIAADDIAGAAASWSSPVAVDAVDGAVAVVCDPPSGAMLPPGTTTVTCDAADSAGNVASGSFTVRVAAPEPPAAPPDPPDPPNPEPDPLDSANGQGVADSVGTTADDGTGTLPDTSMAAPSQPATTLGLFLVLLALIVAITAIGREEAREPGRNRSQ